jgi:hypothetical protein
MIFFIPYSIAVVHFYLIPPTGSTWPLSVIYPVIDRFYRTGIFNSKETRQATIVTPAEGPSFFIPPAGKCICNEILSSSSRVSE